MSLHYLVKHKSAIAYFLAHPVGLMYTVYTMRVAMIDGVFCLDTNVIYKRQTLSVITLEGSKIMSTYNTPDTVVRDRKTWNNYSLVIIIAHQRRRGLKSLGGEAGSCSLSTGDIMHAHHSVNFALLFPHNRGFSVESFTFLDENFLTAFRQPKI